eukprot:SAG22_NODE_205_length_15308_cov_20.539023_22_plen_290_part_00
MSSLPRGGSSCLALPCLTFSGVDAPAPALGGQERAGSGGPDLSQCTIDKCLDVGQDCCAPQALLEVAACADGYGACAHTPYGGGTNPDSMLGHSALLYKIDTKSTKSPAVAQKVTLVVYLRCLGPCPPVVHWPSTPQPCGGNPGRGWYMCCPPPADTDGPGACHFSNAGERGGTMSSFKQVTKVGEKTRRSPCFGPCLAPHPIMDLSSNIVSGMRTSQVYDSQAAMQVHMRSEQYGAGNPWGYDILGAIVFHQIPGDGAPGTPVRLATLVFRSMAFFLSVCRPFLTVRL